MVAVSLRNLLKFQNSVYSSSIDVLIITEIWLNDSIFKNEILPDNYKIYHRDCGTKYTPLHYSSYLRFCVRYTSSVNYIKFPAALGA